MQYTIVFCEETTPSISTCPKRSVASTEIRKIQFMENTTYIFKKYRLIQQLEGKKILGVGEQPEWLDLEN